jgi:hypothetical protein
MDVFLIKHDVLVLRLPPRHPLEGEQGAEGCLHLGAARAKVPEVLSCQELHRSFFRGFLRAFAGGWEPRGEL